MSNDQRTGTTAAITRGADRPVTVDRIERAIHTVATMMVKHDMDLSPTIERLEAERDKLQRATSAMDRARNIIAKGRNEGSNITDLRLA